VPPFLLQAPSVAVIPKSAMRKYLDVYFMVVT
jgi:hypothetical protein